MGEAATLDMGALRGGRGRVVDHGGRAAYLDWETPRELFELIPGRNELVLSVLAGTAVGVLGRISWRTTWL